MVFIVCSVDLVSFCLCLESTSLNTYCHSYSPVKALDQGTSLDLEFVLGHCTLPTGPLGKVKFVHYKRKNFYFGHITHNVPHSEIGTLHLTYPKGSVGNSGAQGLLQI